MTNPFDNTHNAFQPFYSDYVILTMRNGDRQTLLCSVFDDVDDDPVSDEALDTNRSIIRIVTRESDLHFVGKIARGDKIEYNGKKYVIIDSQISMVCISFKAREC